jgi:hypothetical protein
MMVWVHVFVIAWILGWASTAYGLLKAERDAGMKSWECQVPGLIMLLFVWPVIDQDLRKEAK